MQSLLLGESSFRQVFAASEAPASLATRQADKISRPVHGPITTGNAPLGTFISRHPGNVVTLNKHINERALASKELVAGTVRKSQQHTTSANQEKEVTVVPQLQRDCGDPAANRSCCRVAALRLGSKQGIGSAKQEFSPLTGFRHLSESHAA